MHLQSSTHTNDWAHTAQTNVVLGVFHGQTLGRIDDGSFRGVVPDQARSRSDTGGGSNVDKHTAIASLLHVWHNNVDRVEDALDVDVHDQVVVLLGHIVVALVAVCSAGIVDDDVDLAIRIDSLLQGVLPVGTLGDIAKYEFATEVLRGLGANGLYEVGDDDLCALGQELLDDALTKTLS